MTWLRWETTAAQSDVVGYLAEALRIELAHAFGLYVACCLGFGEHQPDGMASAVSDATLEHWALWRGRRGRFAASFRARCVDEDGQVRGWWRQLKLLERQERDRLKPDGRKKSPTNPPPIPPESPMNPPRDSRGIFGGNVTERSTETELPQHHPPPRTAVVSEHEQTSDARARTRRDRSRSAPEPIAAALPAALAHLERTNAETRDAMDRATDARIASGRPVG